MLVSLEIQGCWNYSKDKIRAQPSPASLVQGRLQGDNAVHRLLLFVDNIVQCFVLWCPGFWVSLAELVGCDRQG